MNCNSTVQAKRPHAAALPIAAAFLGIVIGGVFAAAGLAAELSAPKANAPRIAPASNEAELAIKRFKVEPGFKVELFAAEPLLAHPVAFAVDEQNHFYVVESFRVGEQVTDIRRHMNWLDEELASTNTAQFRRLIEKYLDPRFMTAETERISVLEDTDGDGKADKSTVFADGFNDVTSGIAAGVLARKGDVWFTCIPDVWLLRDNNGDGQADVRESLHHGYAVRFGYYGHDLHGLRIGPDGKLYFSIGDRGLNVISKEGRQVASPESGAVLRCNLDGTDLELFATGLRNPQELAFDQYGNLFTGDNNSDGGDEARWVYLVEGGDSGWRIGWQFITSPVPRGPWNAEKMWRPQNEEQPAFIVPPLLNFANGPSGVAFYPGLGLPREYDNHFFLCDFKGNSAQSLIHSFALRPKGASFEVVDRKPFISQVVATDVDFGMDGAVYLADWVEGWGKTGKGRIYRVHHPEHRANPLVNKTRELIARGFENRGAEELTQFLSWPDQRVRQEAQFELAARGISSIPVLAAVAARGSNQMARLHAIWGLGLIHTRHAKTATPARAEALDPLVPLLQDSDPEVRGQAAKVLGDGNSSKALAALGQLAMDTKTPRAQFFAAMALGKIGGKQAIGPVIEMLRQNDDQDAFLRHAGVMALFRSNDPAVLQQAGTDQSRAVRLAALIAMRRLRSPQVAQFLQDRDPALVLEAARAIYDLPIDEAMPKLAALIAQPPGSEPLLRRVINANHRTGRVESAMALAKFASTPFAPDPARIEALATLGDWVKPSGRDRVTGLWRPIAERDGRVAAEAVRPALPGLLASSSDPVRAAAARLAGQYRIAEAREALVKVAKSPQASSAARVEALRALAEVSPSALSEVLEMAASSRDEDVRIEATALMAKANPARAAANLAGKLQSGSLREKQAAFSALGALGAAANEVVAEWAGKLVAGDVEPALQLEVIEVATQRRAPALESKLQQFEKTRPTNEIGRYIETLFGGNAANGRKIFFEKAEASCARCHKVNGEGGDAGPPLDKMLAGRSREYLLESIVAPGKQIAPGYENVIVSLKDGASYLGTLKAETENELVLNSPEEGGLITIDKKNIGLRRQGGGGSGMPEGVADLLSKRELRDLVEFLASLN